MRVVTTNRLMEYCTQIRVSYADTDRMGFVHHSNYARYFETARWEMFRAMGLSYKEIEAGGLLMPVISMKMDFIRPAFYDDLLTIKSIVLEAPRARMFMDFEMYNERHVLIHKARIGLAFLRADTLKPCLPPEEIRRLFVETCVELDITA